MEAPPTPSFTIDIDFSAPPKLSLVNSGQQPTIENFLNIFCGLLNSNGGIIQLKTANKHVGNSLDDWVTGLEAVLQHFVPVVSPNYYEFNQKTLQFKIEKASCLTCQLLKAFVPHISNVQVIKSAEDLKLLAKRTVEPQNFEHPLPLGSVTIGQVLLCGENKNIQFKENAGNKKTIRDDSKKYLLVIILDRLITPLDI
jgi:hypothetical protein